MNPLPLTPLPATRLNEDSASWEMEREGFVDEAVVAKLLATSRSSRLQASRLDLALAADDLDFAGWQMDSTSLWEPTPLTEPAFALSTSEEMPSIRDIVKRRATPPVIAGSAISHPRLDSRRWWLAGVAGAVSTVILALLLFALSSSMSQKTPADSANSAAPASARKAVKGDPPAPLAASPRDSRH